MIYKSNYFGSSVNFDLIIVGISANALAVKYCVVTDREPTITYQQALSSDKNPSGAVFEDPNGVRYSINARRRVTKSTWQCNENAFLMIGIEHDHPLSIDFNRDCQYLDRDFDQVESWCNNQSFYPFVAMYIKDKIVDFDQNQVIIFNQNRSNIITNITGTLTSYSSIDQYYVDNKLQAQCEFTQQQNTLIANITTNNDVSFVNVEVDGGTVNTTRVDIVNKQGTIVINNSAETLTLRCLHNYALVGEFKHVASNNV